MARPSVMPRYRQPLGDHRHTSECTAQTGEIVEWFKVSERTVRRWANTGKVWSIRPAGGGRRYCWVDLLSEQS